MKTVLLFFSILLSGFYVNAQEGNSITVTVTIENVLSDEGTLLVSLHTKDTFMKGPGIIDLAEKARKGAVTLTLEDVKPGTYAVMAMHDANDNKRMDYQDNGMPKESYGMSGNDMTMGPPTFDSAKFEVTDQNLEFTIRF